MKSKEDLIGTEWKCPKCNEIEIININGVDHKCNKYWDGSSLKELFEMKEYYTKLNRKIFYGE